MTKPIDLLAGAAFLAIGLAVVFVLIPLAVDEPKRIQFTALAPSYYPRLIGYLIALTGAAIIGFSLRLSNVKAGEPEKLILWKIPAVLSVMAAFYLLLPLLGFVLGGAIALLALLLLAGERSLNVLILVSVVLPLVLYFFFVKAAGIPIPSGLLEPILVRI